MSKITEAQRQAFIDAICDELNADEVRDDYSGRGMYGKTCYGVVTKNPEAVLMEAGRAGLPVPRQDSMGLSTIIYWPQIGGAS